MRIQHWNRRYNTAKTEIKFLPLQLLRPHICAFRLLNSFSWVFSHAPSLSILHWDIMGPISVFVSVVALVTFAVSHLRLAVYCISLKCVIAASLGGWECRAEEEKWTIFKNVFVVKPESLTVDGCAAAEEQNPSACQKGGNAGVWEGWGERPD